MVGAALVALALVGYALFAQRLERRSITGPIVFVALGLVLGPVGLGLLGESFEGETTLLLTELTLALLLFADASTVPLRDVRADLGLPGRLLGIGLPLTMILGTLLAKAMFPEISWAGAALIACILAPTDAALGLAVVTNKAVPVRIRRALNVESGLNDGIATPFVMLFLALVAIEEGGGGTEVGAVLAIGLAVVVAVAVGGLGGWLLIQARVRGWTSGTSEQIAGVGLALLAYSAAVAMGGNGFVSAFLGGLVFGAVTRGHEHRAIEFTETVALIGSLLVWTIFGAVFLTVLLTTPTSWTAIGYALLSLTVIRILPVALALVGQGFRVDTLAFIGWFGPRGLASVVFTLLAVEGLHGGGTAVALLFQVASWTILLSVLLHGLTAGPLGALYGRRINQAGPGTPELAGAAEPKMRRRTVGG
jgi:NhaP-type Na+/H+ or K+/H+ antiporter